MMSIRKSIVGLVLVLAGLVGAAWLGTRIKMQNFEIPERVTKNLGTIKPPSGLPAPVARYVQAAFGDEIPVVESALVIGTAEATFNGITLPARFKFYHQAGQGYYHYIQAGWFGQPVATVNEQYLDGRAILEIPGQHIENIVTVNAAANQGMWSEAIWFPSIWFTDERVKWEAVDDTTARLIFPDAAPEEYFTVHFDPDTGLIADVTTLRYREPHDTERIPWTPRTFEWGAINGVQVPIVSNIQWGSDAPWVTWHVESVLYNVDVSARFAQFGGDFQD